MQIKLFNQKCGALDNMQAMHLDRFTKEVNTWIREQKSANSQFAVHLITPHIVPWVQGEYVFFLLMMSVHYCE